MARFLQRKVGVDMTESSVVSSIRIRHPHARHKSLSHVVQKLASPSVETSGNARIVRIRLVFIRIGERILFHDNRWV
jgi:hypothetical protein